MTKTVALPCDVGDIIYRVIVVGKPKIVECVVVGFLLDKSGWEYSYHATSLTGGRIVRHGKFTDFGKTTFFTREEAERNMPC